MKPLNIMAMAALLALSVLARANAESLGLSDIAGQIRRADELAQSLELPENRHEEAGREISEELMQRFNDPRHQAAISQERQRLRETIFSDVIRDYQAPAGEEGENQEAPGRLAEDERVYLFISSSIPPATLQTYLAMIERTREPNMAMVLRGFVGGMKTVQPTLQYLYSALQKDPSCEPLRDKCDAYEVNILIDPLLFRQYGINKVPAVVYAAGVAMGETGRERPGGPVFIIEGDAALDYLLERINREGNSETLAGLIRALQGAQ